MFRRAMICWMWPMCCVAALGQEQPGAEPAGKANDAIRFRLMEGSDFSGRLSVDVITVTTEFGKLQIPVRKIVSFTPGLNSHPEERARINRLILQLGSNNAKEREESQKILAIQGAAIRRLLERFADDKDPERRMRIKKLLEDLDQLDDELAEGDGRGRELRDQDEVETTLFTVVGEISPKAFTLQTRFGELTVKLSDIRRVEREQAEKPEVRRKVQVTGQNLTGFDYKSSGLRVTRGDRVVITADGKIAMQPWGNGQFSGPDGNAMFQLYKADIFNGALIARIGPGGKEFKVGKRATFVASKTGVLYFAVAMNAQWTNQGYAFPGNYDVLVRVNPK